MKSWGCALRDALIGGMAVAAATALAASYRGRRDSGSAIAPINATSHALWGDAAAEVERFTWKHTVPGYVIHTLAAIFWMTIFEKLFGEAAARDGARTAVLGASTTAALAYVTDYKIVPERLTPGYEKRLAPPSLWLTYVVLALGMAAGAIARRRLSVNGPGPGAEDFR